MNQLVALLTTAQKSSVSVVFVGPTANSVLSNSYMTNPSDSIISSIRTYSTSSGQFPAPLATNKAAVVFSSSFDLGLNHDFIGYV